MDRGFYSKKKMKKKAAWLVFSLFFLFSLLIVQFYRVQILEGEKWIKEARKQHFLVVKEPFMRGKFLSNSSIKKGHPEKEQYFVFDVQKFHLYADPLSIPEKYKEEVGHRLLDILTIPKEKQKSFIDQFYKRSRSRKLAMWLEREEREAVASWWRTYSRKRKIPVNAIFFINDYQRSYPFGKLLGQVLHTVQHGRDPVSKQAVPTGGLELFMNRWLRGTEGKRLLLRSPRNALEMGKVIAHPEHGADVHLTINHYLQAITEEELEKGVKKANARGGWAVMMNPYTGEILALAQYPFFYPPDYQYYYNQPGMADHTRVHALTDANEPGSIMKPITLAVALTANKELEKKGENPLFHPEEKIASADGRFPGRKQPIKDVSVHRYLNMCMGLQRSSNIYFARLVERVIDRLGDMWYHDKLQNLFGFGVKTGVELPAESRGLLPTIGKMHPNGTMEWSKSTPYSLAMGYNLQANSIQLLRAYSVLANGGYLVSPTIVRKITKKKSDGTLEVLFDNTIEKRQGAFPRVLASDVVQETVKALKYTTKPGGTSRRGDIPGYTEAAKTGTARKIINGVYTNQKHIASFVGFCPVEKPVFALIISIDEPEVLYIPGIGNQHHGSICAAPIFREIGKRTLEYLGAAPDDPHGYPAGDPRYDPAKAYWIPETKQLQEIYEKWNK